MNKLVTLGQTTTEGCALPTLTHVGSRSRQGLEASSGPDGSAGLHRSVVGTICSSIKTGGLSSSRLSAQRSQDS